MNYVRLLLAALGGTAAYFFIGFLVFALLPLADEFRKYPAVYRDQKGIQRVMPLGMLAMFFSILALAVLYAYSFQGVSGALEGARFGALIGIFTIGAFVMHNYVNLNIGWKLTMQQSIVYFLEWIAVGIAIGVIYQPAAA